jgi:peptide/nickel transport system substrate-binding protein
VLGWSLGFDQDLYQLWHSSQSAPPALNFVSYANPRVDQLIEKARTEFDMDKVKQYAHEVHRLIYEDQPYMFLFYPESNAAMPKGLYVVKRPDRETGEMIQEPIRRTKLGFTIYQKWWMREQPALAP